MFGIMPLKIFKYFKLNASSSSSYVVVRSPEEEWYVYKL